MGKYIKLIRLKHWIKNFLIFVPAFFGKVIFDIDQWVSLLIGFVSFSLVTSFVYIINDINDVELDKLSPTKSKRPIASGKISVKKASAIAGVFVVIALLLNIFILKDIWVLGILLVYAILNVLYSKGLKNYPIVDLVILSSGFVLRVVYGSLIVGVEISAYLYLTVLAMSLYLSSCKRRNEIKNSADARKSLKFYTYDYLNGLMHMCQTLLLVFYSLWCSDEATIARVGNNHLLYTVPLVLVICMLYNYICDKNPDGDPVEVITKSKLLLLLGTALCVSVLFIIY